MSCRLRVPAVLHKKGEIVITIKVNNIHGTYWNTLITTEDGANSVAATGPTPKESVITAMCLLSWFDKQEGPNAKVALACSVT